MSILAFAENHEKLHSKLSVLRFSSGTKYEEALQKFIKAFWFNGTPRPGIYFTNSFALWLLRKLKHVGRLSSKLYKDELGIILFSEVALIRTKEKRAFAVVLPENTQGQSFTVTPPNCDYFAIPERVNDLKTLMAWLGIPDKPFIPKKEKKPDVD